MTTYYSTALFFGIWLFSTACAQQPVVEDLSEAQGIHNAADPMAVEGQIPNEMLQTGGSFEDMQGRYLTREQMQDIRNRVVANGTRTVIRTIEPDSCIAPGAYFTINGSGFGESQGSKRVWLSRRGVDIQSAAIVSWSDSVIVARATGADLNGRYFVGIKEGPSRYISNVTKDIDICPIEIGGVSIEVEPWVAPIRLDCFDLDLSRIDLVCDDTCKIVDGERVVHDYGIYIEWIAAGRPHRLYNDMFFIIEGAFEQQCIGPTPATYRPYEPEYRREGSPIVLWEKDDTFDTRTARNSVRSITYALHCGEMRDRWSAEEFERLEVRRVEGDPDIGGFPDPTWAVGYAELHGTDPDGEPREFWFVTIYRYDSESDAIRALRLIKEAGIRSSCTSSVDFRGNEFQPFRFWSSD